MSTLVDDFPDTEDPAPEPSLQARLANLPDVVAQLAAAADEHDREASFPYDGIAAVHRAHLLTLTVGRRYGGPGATAYDLVSVLRELGRGDPAVALVSAMTHFVHLAQDVQPTWPVELYAQVLRDGRRSPVLLNALRVEPDLGTPARGGLPATTARRTSDGWRITGRKIFSTGSVGLAWMLVWAATDEPIPRVGSFIVPATSAGVSIEPTWDHLGLRASASHDVVFDDVAVPIDHHLDLTEVGSPPQGGAAGAQLAAIAGLVTTALYVGVARNALDWVADFVTTRTPTALGAPLSTLPRFQAAVGDIALRIDAAEQLIEAAALGIDAADPVAIARAAAGGPKVAATRELIAAVEQAVALVGNPGLSRRHPLQRHYRDVLCSRVHTPQDDAVTVGIGRSLLSSKG
ncbi:MAG: acyl-CoA dehydrogenase [Actinomycetota bacterium]|nr:MAG: acyl-CoA dehydrogenase [Actinomycetota bacterium]